MHKYKQQEVKCSVCLPIQRDHLNNDPHLQLIRVRKFIGFYLDFQFSISFPLFLGKREKNSLSFVLFFLFLCSFFTLSSSIMLIVKSILDERSKQYWGGKRSRMQPGLEIRLFYSLVGLALTPDCLFTGALTLVPVLHSYPM